MKSGDRLFLREWTGRAYASPQRSLGEADCLSVRRIRISRSSVELDGGNQSGERFRESEYRSQLDAFARADGFTDWHAMRDWFEAEHGLPFRGVVIAWAQPEPALNDPHQRAAKEDVQNG